MISIVIPTRHRNDALAACLRCLAPGSQTLSASNYEVIVTDDGSASTAEAMIHDQFTWARWVAGPRRGPAANRNCGAGFARGNWIAFTDDDCLPSPTWLSSYETAIVAGGEVFEGKTTCEAGLRSIMEQAPVNLFGGNLWSCNMMISCEVFRKLGGFDDRFPHAAVEDLEFHARVNRSGLSIHFVQGAVVDHPPRPRRRGAASAITWEGRALMKALDPPTLREPLPLHVAKVRISELINAKPSVQSLRFAWSSIIEVVLVMRYARTWTLRHAGAAPKSVPWLK